MYTVDDRLWLMTMSASDRDIMKLDSQRDVCDTVRATIDSITDAVDECAYSKKMLPPERTQ